jgi:hypothetical protein
VGHLAYFLVRSRLSRSGVCVLAFLSFSEAVDTIVANKSLQWCESTSKADVERHVLGPCGKSWSEVRMNLSCNGIIEAKVGSVRYLLHIPASASEVTVDVSRISPESQRNFSCSRRPKLPLCTVADDDDACLENSFGTADGSDAVSRRC